MTNPEEKPGMPEVPSGSELEAERTLSAMKAKASGKSEKLQKVLADLGLGSRRAMEVVIDEGRVEVNGKTAYLGLRVFPEDEIRVDGKKVSRDDAEEDLPRVLLYNKPEGEIVSMKDPEGRPSVFDHLPPIDKGRWIVVGRLDFNTEGLLIFTSSGQLANLLMHPRNAIEREYMVRVTGKLTDEMGERLVTGVMLDDGPARFAHISDQGGTGLNHWYLVRLSEGRNREVRRMFEAVGLVVSRLIRVRFGDLELPRGLRRGEKSEMSRGSVQEWLLHLKLAQQKAAEKGEFSHGHGRKSAPRRDRRSQAPKRENREGGSSRTGARRPRAHGSGTRL